MSGKEPPVSTYMCQCIQHTREPESQVNLGCCLRDAMLCAVLQSFGYTLLRA